jgi:lambda family phage tail tape measure protein
MKQNIAQLKQELTELLNPVNQITGAAGAIGQAFSTSFINVINGSQTAQEALAGFFRNIGNYFLDMAGQIIAKMITMAILNTVVGLLPGGAAPSTKTNSIQSGSDFGLKGNIISMGGPDFAAKGAYFAGGVAKFAMGGIVNRPTMFAYANGGTGRFGLMGEAGPEAIMPLKRGPDGKLGVAGGGGVSVGQINITVENKGEQLSPAAQKQIANQVQGIVLANLVNERRSGGILR